MKRETLKQIKSYMRGVEHQNIKRVKASIAEIDKLIGEKVRENAEALGDLHDMRKEARALLKKLQKQAA